VVDNAGRPRAPAGQAGQSAACDLGAVAANSDRAIIISDSGSCANWFARDLKMRPGFNASLSGGLAWMSAAVPYAIAAKYAAPDRAVIALVGDGAMQMNNMAELITVANTAATIAGSSVCSTMRTSTR
jgi:thiamine pyrophosphate-dependent acetolactate synthase large subunit-like protein